MDDQIDELAADIERTIEDGERFLAQMPDFEEGRRMRRANSVVNVEEILNG